MLLENIEGMLEESGYKYCEYSGCFDIAARKDSMLLLKVLNNVDSFQEEQASNLKALSNSLEARPFLIGLHTRREVLSDNILYDRFDIPTVNPQTLERILHGSIPSVYRFRGGLFVEMDPGELKKARQDSGLSQSQLAQAAGITKKSVYEHESRKMKVLRENAIKIEKILNAKVTTSITLKEYDTELTPRSKFEGNVSRKFRQMGFETGSVYQTPFNMIAKDSKFVLLSDIEENRKKAEKNVSYISKFSKLSKKSAIIITKEEANFDVPTVRQEDLVDMKSNDIMKLVKKW